MDLLIIGSSTKGVTSRIVSSPYHGLVLLVYKLQQSDHLAWWFDQGFSLVQWWPMFLDDLWASVDG